MKNLFVALAVIFVTGCNDQTAAVTKNKHSDSNTAKHSEINETPASTIAGDAATIMSRKQVPILCYHHIKDVPVLPKNSIGYTVTYQTFKNHMKALADSGYHTVLPDQLYDYLVYGKALPEKPVMITFDDTDEDQFTLGKSEMDKYKFKGVYFIMTIAMNKPHYMSSEQIRQLSDEGHVIASHTWDHNRTDRYITGDRMIPVGNKQMKFNDWDVQLTQTKKKLEQITGKKIDYFAYPFGVWNAAGIPEIKSRGYKMAFQLATKRDSLEPLYTVRRIIVAPSWSGEGLIRSMKISFK
jgi:peptidoglycan/xylan/chitin deacetylase (PgdA/CDA1 family)